MSISSFSSSLLITLLALLPVLAWFILKFLAEFSRNRLQGGCIQVIQSLNIGNRERAMLAKIDGQDYVLGVTVGGTNVIDRLEHSLEVDVESRLGK